jgi:hypothetical protein
MLPSAIIARQSRETNLESRWAFGPVHTISQVTR